MAVLKTLEQDPEMQEYVKRAQQQKMLGSGQDAAFEAVDTKRPPSEEKAVLKDRSPSQESIPEEIR